MCARRGDSRQGAGSPQVLDSQGLNTRGFGPYGKHGGLGSGVYDLAIIGAESSLCKMNVGNSSVLLYNSWRLAQLEKQACRTVFSSSFSTSQKQSSPVSLTPPQGHVQPALHICASHVWFYVPSPNTDMRSAFSSAQNVSLDCDFLGCVCCVCEEASQPLLSCSRR